MQVNWKVRLKNKLWLSSMAALVVSFVYNFLAMIDVVPAIGEDLVMSIVNTVLTMLGMLGIVVDPTTKGMSDSEQAMTYEEPKG